MTNRKTIVLKFGGSVLHSQADFPTIAHEIQRFSNQGYSVIAVLSAYYGKTERLIAQATEQQIATDSVAYAEMVARGEYQSTADLVAYLVLHDIPAALRTPADFDFFASGSRTSAAPVSICADKIRQATDAHPVIVMPGFSAVDELGECVLLGRGGSDISAVCLADALGLESVRLLKDVDGLYDRDPNKNSAAQRYACVDYITAIRIGGELVQEEAVRFAQNKDIGIDIAGISRTYSTRVGTNASQLVDEQTSTPRMDTAYQAAC
ncbi:MAG: hypothetical protein AAF431_15520 [Pseudomonadota bacterium]